MDSQHSEFRGGFRLRNNYGRRGVELPMADLRSNTTVTDMPTAFISTRRDADRHVSGSHTYPPGGAAGMRILLVDDHVDTVRMMSVLLERHGYVVRTAGTVREALAIAAAEDVDVLVSDIGLPDGSGIELLQAMRKIRAITGIAFSGFGMPDDIQRSMEAGFQEHLIKPAGFSQLCSLLEGMRKS
jgi:CheY-like chemotaxis protein